LNGGKKCRAKTRRKKYGAVDQAERTFESRMEEREEEGKTNFGLGERVASKAPVGAFTGKDKRIGGGWALLAEEE